ncbi:hypothetical protein [Arenimonas oryziterrae]|uniref:Uncharacterized protein n=1 Tax=Arenimonas oryziterrae DSM 21050 = YC6267 TaxID=1121015 RepID=A0A091AXL8_9GAMM|nr:hypothetical protein [Arenimonas oryziterrae]KFN44206.1 hypothetical protein N789_07250 [Arenimonas oryziterrae DSM 21050 = YC6267]
MPMLWDQYVFRRGPDANELWDRLFEGRPTRLLYIAGGGFDVRAQTVMRECINSIRDAGATVEHAKLALIEFSSYTLDPELEELTKQNIAALSEMFSEIGSVQLVPFGQSEDGEEVSASSSLRSGTDAVLQLVGDETDIILDASSLPRVVYLALMTSLLNRLVPDKSAKQPLFAGGVNFQVLVAEDAGLDGQIMAEDPSSEIVLVPGFSGAMQAESVQDWPLVWFPILGEHRVQQLEQIMKSDAIPEDAEICPVLPHPSKDPRRADRLLLEYRDPLFRSRRTPSSNILYVHEAHPFEAYRQLLGAMARFRDSMEVLGGCRLVVTPFGSKLITLGAGLACFEMRPQDLGADYGVAIPHAEPTRYVVQPQAIRNSRPEVCSLLLTGEAYGVKDDKA